jgi:CO dehydrogenase nickel-insertion accessory protein CooC1
MEVTATAMAIVLNRVRDPDCLERARDLFVDTPVEVLGALPEDAELSGNDERGEPILHLSPQNPVVAAVDAIMRRCTASARAEAG